MLTLLESSKKAAKHLMQAIEHNSKHQYNLAILELNSAITLSPKNYDALLLRGKLLLQQEKYSRALEDFNNTTKINPKNFEGWHYKGLVLYVLEKYEPAVKAFDQAIEYDGSCALLHMHKANALGTMCRIGDAIKSYNIALKLDPNNSLIHLNKGFFLHVADRIPDALLYLERAVQLDDQDSCVQMILGGALALENLDFRALEHYKTGFKLNVKYPWYNYYPLCKVLYEMLHDNMSSYLNNAPDDGLCILHTKALALMSLFLFDKAEEVLEVSHEVVGDVEYCSSTHIVNSSLLCSTNKYIEALKAIEKAQMLFPERGNAYFDMKGPILCSLERFHEAAIEYEKVKSNFSNDADFYHTYAIIMYKLGRFKEAEVAINTSIKIDDYTDSKGHLLEGNILSALGKYKEALRQYNKALQLDMFEDEARLGIGDALIKLKQFDKALQYMKDYYKYNTFLHVNASEILSINGKSIPWYRKLIIRIVVKGAEIYKKTLVRRKLTELLLKKYYMYYINAKSDLRTLCISSYIPQFINTTLLTTSNKNSTKAIARQLSMKHTKTKRTVHN